MERIDLATVVAARDEWDRAVDCTDGVDRWSSGSDWAFAAHATWGQGPELILRNESGIGCFGRIAADGADALVGLDPVWAFSSPIIGHDPASFAPAVADELHHETDWDLIFLTGMVAGSSLDSACIQAFGRRHQLFAGPSAMRLVADVSDIEWWWAERGDKFRRNIRRARRNAAAHGLVIDVIDDNDVALLMTRLMAVEAGSWKGQEASGLLGGEMADFYTSMAVPLQLNGRLRAAVAVLDGVDVGFILGAVRGTTYRGLQVSFTAGFESLSIGHLLQDHEIHRVASSGVARYDLGMEMPYKYHWASSTEETRTVIVRR